VKGESQSVACIGSTLYRRRAMYKEWLPRNNFSSFIFGFRDP